MKKVLIISPHTDDAELGMGGTICKLRDEGVELMHIAFSHCPKAVPKDLPDDTTRSEYIESCKLMKAIDGKFTIPEREYPEHRQAILELMLKVRDMFNPDTVFIPSHNDTHQDHATVHQEAIRAFKRLNVYGYELPWNVMEGCPSIYSILEERHLDGKMELIRCYKSESHREYMQAGAVTAQMRFRGLQAGVQYAEAFYHYRTFWT